MTNNFSSRRTRAALVLAGVPALATGLVLGLGGGADASSANASERTAAQPAVELVNLLQPADIDDAFRVSSAIRSVVSAGNGSYGMSACTGEEQMGDVVGKAANYFYGVYTARAAATNTKFTVDQSVADQSSAKRAATKYAFIVRQVRGCQHEPAGHWRYGVAHRLTIGGGTATWMTTTNGDGTSAGGIVVALSGRHLAVAEGNLGAAPAIRRLAVDTLRQLR